MKKIAKTTAFVAVLLLAASLSYSQETPSDRVTVPFSNPGKPGFITVNMQRGSITIKGYSGNEVVVEAILRESKVGEFEGRIADSMGDFFADAAEKKNEKKQSEKTAGLKKLSLPGSTGLSVEEKNNKMEIKTRALKNSVDLTVQVPFTTSLDLNAMMGGSITVENVTGEIEVSNMAGSIQLTGISGTVLANTMAGGIVAVFKEVNPDKPMSFSTMAGDIDVTLPPATKANLKMKTDYGEVYSDFEIAISREPQRVEAEPEEEQGRYRIAFDNYFLGSINGGGQEFTLKTSTGDILIRKSK